MKVTKNLKTQSSQNNQGRLLFMDGLRGIAIILVFFYHAYSDQWAKFTPYGDRFDSFFLFRYGEYGVPLFFLISGFVIAMTLEKCTTFRNFMLRRWIRLFPAMLVVSCLIPIISIFINKRPYGAPVLSDIMPGLLFIQTEFFEWSLGRGQGVLEPSFWSLFVEMKFYVVSGFLYFILGLRKMIFALVIMYGASLVFNMTQYMLPVTVAEPLALFFKYSDYIYYGWFASGALFYQYYMSKDVRYWLGAIVIGLLSARGLDGFMTVSMVFATSLVMLFAFSLNVSFVQKALSNKFLLFFGFISYPFYLIHVSSLVSMIRQLGETFPAMPHWTLPIFPILLLVIIGWLLAKYAEPVTRTWIKNMLGLHINKSQ